MIARFDIKNVLLLLVLIAGIGLTAFAVVPRVASDEEVAARQAAADFVLKVSERDFVGAYFNDTSTSFKASSTLSDFLQTRDSVFIPVNDLQISAVEKVDDAVYQVIVDVEGPQSDLVYRTSMLVVDEGKDIGWNVGLMAFTIGKYQQGNLVIDQNTPETTFGALSL